MPKQVFDQYRSELRQGEEKPWYDFSDLPVWSGTLPGTPEDASHISTELAKDISPVVGPYRSGVRSTREYNKMMGLIDEGDYTGAIEPGIWSLLESADVGLSSLPLLGGVLSAPIDLARAVRPIFTSPAKKAVSEVTKEALPAQQWAKQLEGRGVKKDELEWTGLGDFLKGRKGNITKTEMDEFIESNQIQVQEVLKGTASESEKGVMFDKHLQELELDLRTMDEEDLVSYLSNNVDEMGMESNVLDNIEIETTGWLRRVDKDEVIDEILNLQHSYYQEVPDEALMELGVDLGENAAKFDDPRWQLPGGDNYREVLLTLPEKTTPWTKENVILHTDPKGPLRFLDSDNYWYFKTPDGLKDIPKKTRWGKTFSQEEALEQVLREKPTSKSGFTGGHYDEPNVLAHIRFNERVDPDGKKVLFIEEIQSDWAQKGRKKGFRGNPITEADVNRKEWIINRGEEIRKEIAGLKETPGPDAVERGRMLLEERRFQVAEFEDIVKKGEAEESAIPRGPFLEDTNQWANLSLKRMIRWAADNNFDSIGWTTGKQQAARYDLSKQLDELAYRIEDDGKYHLQGLKDEQKIFDTYVEESELSDTVGKELAEKIIKKEGKQAYHTERQTGLDIMDPGETVPRTKIFSGIDLEIGGEGMAGFYDDIVVNQAKKIGKKHGAKVEKTDLINKKIDKSAMVSEEKITGWDQQLEETGISTHYDIDSGDEGFVVFSRHEKPDDWISAEEMRMAGGVKVDEWQAHLAEQIAKAYRQNHSVRQAVKIEGGSSESAVWTMKLTDKLKKAAKEGLPYYAVMPPALLAAGVQEERQSLLE